MFDPREKIALFIDGANLYATSRALGFDIDYRKLLSSFQKRGYLLRAYYYTALVEKAETKPSKRGYYKTRQHVVEDNGE